MPVEALESGARERLSDADLYGLEQQQTVEAALSDRRSQLADADLPEWIEQTTGALVNLSRLQSNWNSYGAPPIDRAILRKAAQFLLEVMRNSTPAPSVVPTSRGGVQFEWHTRGVDLEIEFLSPVRVRGSFEDYRSGETWDEDLSYNMEPLTKAVARLSKA